MRIEKIENVFATLTAEKEANKQRLLEQEQKKRLEFEKSLSSAQNAVYQEWKKNYPDKIELDKKLTRWLYKKSLNNYVDELHTYLFDVKGELEEKNVSKVGGGNFHDWVYDSFHESSTYTTAITVYKNGTIYGYYDGSWMQVAELKENGKVYGYHGGSWMQIGEIEEDGDIYGYHGGSWMQVAKVKDENTILGYHGSSSWGEIASFKKDKVYGYNLKGDWTELSMDIVSLKYKIAVIAVIISRHDPRMFK